MRSWIAIPMTLLLAGLAPAGDPGEPALELVSRVELEGPLHVELLEAPALLGAGDEFRVIFRDPRFPSVLLRRHGAVYAAFRQAGPIPMGQYADPVPTDTIFFVGRPSAEEIARIWPEAVVEDEARVAPTASSVRTRTRGVEVETPRMAHQPSRARRLQALARKYAPAE